MLKIRQEQLDVLAEIPKLEFQRQMISHVAEFFPKQSAALEPAGVLSLIKDSIMIAGSYGIEGRADVVRFINLAFLFGAGFNKKLPWANNILNSPIPSSAAMKMMNLNEAAIQHLSHGSTAHHDLQDHV
jgi:hypothetical protein